MEIERWLDQGGLFLVELDSDSEIEIDRKMLSDRLWSIFAKRRGIVIFYTKNDETYEKYADVIDAIVLDSLQMRAKVVKITPKALKPHERLKLVDLIFGFIGVKTELEREGLKPNDVSTDFVFNLGYQKYDEKLKDLLYMYYDILGIVKSHGEVVERIRI